MPSNSAYEPTEPTVIDDELIKDAIVLAPRPAPVTGAFPQPSHSNNAITPEYCDVLQLRFSFCNILKIDHLEGFKALTKLQLDNNVVEKIQGLDCLENLTWLDLSFNQITKIEGLSSLKKLTDLSLADNRITRLEGLDGLEELNCLSLANNQIAHLDQVMNLRQFSNLRTVALAGNPLAQDSEYQSYVMAHVKRIRYLDFRLVDDGVLSHAREQYQDELLELEEREMIVARKALEQAEKAAALKILEKANIIGACDIAKVVFEADGENHRIVALPNVEGPISDYETKTESLYTEYHDYMLTQMQLKNEETSAFEKCLSEARAANDEWAMKKIKELTRAKKEATVLIEEDETVDIDETVMALRGQCTSMVDELLEAETVLVDQFEDVTREYERNVTDITTASLEAISQLFTKVRDVDTAFHDTVTSLALQAWENFNNNDLEVVPDVLRSLLLDKDSLINVVNASHDNHITQIDAREDDVTTREQEWLENTISQVKNNEIKRNRGRVHEIARLADHFRTGFEALEQEDW